MKGIDVHAVLEDLPLAPDPYAASLALGVSAHQIEHDDRIRRYLRKDWTFERTALLDRLVLRLALEELVYHDDVPLAVAIDEAVELAKQFSTDDSGRFVNGILSAMGAEIRPK